MSDTNVSTWREVLTETAAVLGNEQEARFICAHGAGVDDREFSGSLSQVVSQRMGLHVRAMVSRRLTGEPLQYVMGRWSFRHLDLLVDSRVLIPRPETESVVQAALEAARRAPSPRTVVDLGTGSGAIGLSLAQELPLDGTTVWLTDVSADALDVARANIAGLGRAGVNVRVAHGDWYTALPELLRGAVDVIVANPPYIALNDSAVEPSVIDYEPHLALFAGDDGLSSLRAIIADASLWLRASGVLVLEIGHQQGVVVSEMCVAAGLSEPEVRKDFAGHHRIVVAHAPR